MSTGKKLDANFTLFMFALMTGNWVGVKKKTNSFKKILRRQH